MDSTCSGYITINQNLKSIIGEEMSNQKEQGSCLVECYSS